MGVWGDLSKPFVGFKMASMTLRKIKKHTPEKLLDENVKMDDAKEEKPKWATDPAGENQPMSDDEANGQEESKGQNAAAKKAPDAVSELRDLLTFIEDYSDAASFFD